MFSLDFLPSFIAVSAPATLRLAICNVFYLKFILKYFFYFLKVEWAAAFLCYGCETSISDSLISRRRTLHVLYIFSYISLQFCILIPRILVFETRVSRNSSFSFLSWLRSLILQFLTEPAKFESMQIHLSDVSTAVFVVVAKVNHSYFFVVFFILL